MAEAKRIHILMIKVNKLFPLFLAETNMFSLFLSSYTLKQILENKKCCGKIRLLVCVPTAFLVLLDIIETRYVFSIS